MGDAFCQPKTTAVLPSAFARRMSSTEPAWAIRSECSSKRWSHTAMLSRVCSKPSHTAIVALIAVTPPACRLS